MTKTFSLMQLFSLADGRLSTKMDDVYEMLNHLTGDSLFTHHLPVAMEYVEKKNPAWLRDVRQDLSNMGITKSTKFEDAMEIVKASPKTYEIPQLKDETEINDFGDYMVDNSLLKKIGSAL